MQGPFEWMKDAGRRAGGWSGLLTAFHGWFCWGICGLGWGVLGEDIRFPKDSGVIDVTKAPYFAKGDGKTDDTEAIQQALLEHPNQNRIIYLPNGTYLISNPLHWPPTPEPELSHRATILQGQSREGTVIRVADHSAAFGAGTRGASVLWMGGPPAWRDRNAVRNLTINTGEGNPGATGITLMANRQGGLRDVTIRAGVQLKGIAGIDLSHNDSIGPCLIKNVSVDGFDYGLKAAYPQYSATLEHVSFSSQRVAAIRNTGQTLNIRDFTATNTNSVPAIVSADSIGFVTLLDARIEGLPGRRPMAAIQNRGLLFVRNLTGSGYPVLIENRTVTNLNAEGPDIDQFLSHPRVAQFNAPREPLNLPVEETPEVPWDPLEKWASPLAFGGLPNDDIDDSAAIQKAIDSGATTLYLPNGAWMIMSSVEIRGAVRRVIGCEASIRVRGLGSKAAFPLVDGKEPVVVLERLAAESNVSPLIEQASSRRLVISSCSNVAFLGTGRGDLFLEDVSSGTEWILNGLKVWARQWDIERDGAKIVNNGGTLWVMGLTATQPGTIIKTLGGGKTELMGALAVASGGTKSDPMFSIQESSASLICSELAFRGNPFRVIIDETRGGIPRALVRGEAGVDGLVTIRAGGAALPLYTGFDGPGAVPPPPLQGRTNLPVQITR